MIVAKKCYFWSVFPQISCGRYPPNVSKFPKPHFLLTCTYFRGRRHGRNLPMAKATDGLAFGTTRHCRIKGYRPCRRPQRQDLMTGGVTSMTLSTPYEKCMSPSSPSHCETAATGQSLTHGSNCCEEGRKKIASPSNVLYPNHCDTEPLLKTMKSCPSHCETSATRQSLRKLRRERIRKGRAPAGFASKPLQEYSLKNLETLLLEPLKTMKSCPNHCETSATRQSLRKLRRERIRKGRAPAGFASKPLQECSLKNLETLLLEPLKTMKSCPIKTMKTCLSHCETSATRQSLRKLRRERIRKAEPQQVLRPSHCRSAASMKTCCSHCEGQPPGKA